MAPIKFEEHIKDKLDERKIKPSDNAWNKISEELYSTSTSKKYGYFWYAIAASIIGLLLASLFLLKSQNDDILDENQIVNETSKEEILKEEEINTQALPLKNIEIKKGTLVETKSNIPKTLSTKIPKLNKIERDVATENELVAQMNRENVASEKLKKVDFNIAEELINSKINELVAQVDSIESNNTTVTDAEIDVLLRKAQREILEQKIFRNNNNTVDAMALLTEVEDELDLSIRDQLFETLKNGYLKVRTAVADRNN
tara:strand:- start:88970 stop:89743 length:774 start_codon:yes stop_codon:yes gene_type:complete